MGYLVPCSGLVALPYFVWRSRLGLGFVGLLFSCRGRCRAQIVLFVSAYLYTLLGVRLAWGVVSQRVTVMSPRGSGVGPVSNSRDG